MITLSFIVIVTNPSLTHSLILCKIITLHNVIPYQVMKVSTKENLKDKLKWVKFSSIAWTHDNKGFFYQVRYGLCTCMTQ